MKKQKIGLDALCDGPPYGGVINKEIKKITCSAKKYRVGLVEVRNGNDITYQWVFNKGAEDLKRSPQIFPYSNIRVMCSRVGSWNTLVSLTESIIKHHKIHLKGSFHLSETDVFFIIKKIKGDLK